MNQEKLQEMRILEQNLQNILLQKQTFQIELAETKAALQEMEKSSDEVYKIVGQLMIKSEKEKIKKELQDKEKMLELRMGTFEKQEKSSIEKMEKLRDELMKEEK